MDKERKSLIRKLVSGLIFEFLVFAFFYFWKTVLVYLLIFSWWTGSLGFTVWVASFPLIYIPEALGKYKKGMQEIDLKSLEKAMYESQPHVKIGNFLSNHPAEASQLLNGIANKIKNQYSNSSFISSFTLTTPNFVPIEKKVDNNERLLLVEKELQLIQSYNPFHFSKVIYETSKWLRSATLENIPIDPIREVLSHSGFPLSVIDSLHKEVDGYTAFHREAVAYLEKEVAIMGAGIGGENRVNEELQMYEGIWRAFSNVRFEVDGQSVESDNILVSTRGIYTLEVKNYSPKGNYGLHITKDGQWLKVFSNGNEEPTNNVTSQMNRHIALKQKFIKNQWEKDYGSVREPFLLEPIFVIANDTIRIQNDSDLPIMRISQIYHYVMKQPVILTEDQVEKISAIIERNMLPAKKYELKSYEPILEKAYNHLLDKGATMNEIYGMISSYVQESREEILAINEKNNELKTA